MDIKLILSSAVISAIISGCVAVLNFKRQNNLQYVTGERKAWREEIRKIAQDLYGMSYKETLEILVRLKVRINAFGNNEKGTMYMYDAHIWKLIADIEEKKCSKELLRLKQQQLIEYLSLLLKFDWERSKKEVQGDNGRIIGWAICIMSVIYMGCVIVLKNKDINVISVIGVISLLILIIVILYGVVSAILPCTEGKVNIEREYKIQIQVAKLIVGYFKCMIPSMACIFVDWISTEVIIEKYIKNNIDASDSVLIIIAFIFGMVILYFEKASNLDSKVLYVTSINKLHHMYEKKTGEMVLSKN